MPPIPRTDSTAPTPSMLPRTGVGHVADQPHADEHDRDITASSRNPTGQDKNVVITATEQWPDRGGDRRRGADQGVDLRPGGALEVAVDERLHGRQQQRRPEPADHCPEHDDRGQALGERHGHGADGVTQQAEHVGPLAAEEIADLAADQDERGGDQCLQRDRRLHTGDGRVEVAGRRPRSRRSSTTCPRRARTSPSRAGAGASGCPSAPEEWGVCALVLAIR